MGIDHLLDQSDELAEALLAVVDLRARDDSMRVRASYVACSLSLEHWYAVRTLLRGGMLPSAATVHRSQFEAIVRSVWLSYAASDLHVSKLSEVLTLATEQSAKNLPQTSEMLVDIARGGPLEAHAALTRFKDNSWKALNSYVHTGLHPLRRHIEGYPLGLLEGLLCNANGIAVLSCMQAAVLCDRQPLQRSILDVAGKYPRCMPPPL